jgi:hypothetical protein
MTLHCHDSLHMVASVRSSGSQVEPDAIADGCFHRHGEDAYEATPFEGTALSRLLRLVVPQAFAKLDDRAVRGWASNIQHDIQMVRCALFMH